MTPKTHPWSLGFTAVPRYSDLVIWVKEAIVFDALEVLTTALRNPTSNCLYGNVFLVIAWMATLGDG